MAIGDHRQVIPAKPTSAPVAPRQAMASAADSRARPDNGQMAANAAAQATMLAPSGRKFVPTGAVTERMYHQRASSPRLAITKRLRRSGGAVANAASRRAAAINAM